MRCTPGWSTEDEGSHHGLHGRQRGRAWASDVEANMKNVSEVEGGACGAPPVSVHLPVAAVVAPLPQRPSGRGRGTARWCGGES
jgi:hypothetical protein